MMPWMWPIALVSFDGHNLTAHLEEKCKSLTAGVILGSREGWMKVDNTLHGIR